MSDYKKRIYSFACIADPSAYIQTVMMDWIVFATTVMVVNMGGYCILRAYGDLYSEKRGKPVAFIHYSFCKMIGWLVLTSTSSFMLTPTLHDVCIGNIERHMEHYQLLPPAEHCFLVDCLLSSRVDAPCCYQGALHRVHRHVNHKHGNEEAEMARVVTRNHTYCVGLMHCDDIRRFYPYNVKCCAADDSVHELSPVWNYTFRSPQYVPVSDSVSFHCSVFSDHPPGCLYMSSCDGRTEVDRVYMQITRLSLICVVLMAPYMGLAMMGCPWE